MDGDDEFLPPILDYQAAHKGKNKEAIAKRRTGALASIGFGAIAVLSVINPSGEFPLGDNRRYIVTIIACAATTFCLLVAMGRVR